MFDSFLRSNFPNRTKKMRVSFFDTIMTPPQEKKKKRRKKNTGLLAPKLFPWLSHPASLFPVDSSFQNHFFFYVVAGQWPIKNNDDNSRALREKTRSEKKILFQIWCYMIMFAGLVCVSNNGNNSFIFLFEAIYKESSPATASVQLSFMTTLVCAR